MQLLKETEFQDSEIGRVPKSWDIGRLSDVVKEAKSGFSSGERDKTGILQLRMNSIQTDGRINVDGGVRVPTPPNASEYILRKDDVLFNNTNSVDLIGKTAIFKNEFSNSVYSNHLTRLRIDTGRVAPEWITYVMMRKWQLGVFRAMCHRHVHQAGINSNDLLGVKIPIPPLSEQRGVVEVLGVVDSAIELADRVIAKTERLKKGLMQQLLTHGIGHIEYKNTPIGIIPKTWQIAKLDEVSKEVIIGNVNPATPFYTTAEKGIPYFRSQNVRENSLVPTNTYVKREFNQIHPKSILKENDVLTIQTGFIGTSCLVPKMCEGSNCHSLLITRTNPKLLNPRFLCHFLNSDAGKKDVMKHNAGWGRDHLLLEDFRKADIPIPPLDEQGRVVKILSTMYQKAALERNEKMRLERIKTGLMNLLLTGKVRIKVD